MTTSSEQGPGTADTPTAWRTDPRYLNRIRHMLPPEAEQFLALDPTDTSVLTPLLTAELESIDTPDEPARTLLRDLIVSLWPVFVPVGSPSPYDQNEAVGRGGPLSASSAGRIIPPTEPVLAVQYQARHVGDLGSILPTFRPVTFEALTVLHPDGSVSRYVDWNFVMAQLGIVGTQRPVLGRLDASGAVVPEPDGPPPP